VTGIPFFCMAATIWSDSALLDAGIVGALADQQRPLDALNERQGRAALQERSALFGAGGRPRGW